MCIAHSKWQKQTDHIICSDVIFSRDALNYYYSVTLALLVLNFVLKLTDTGQNISPPDSLWCSEGHEVPESVRDFRPGQFYAGYSYLENYLMSSLSIYCKRKKTHKISYPDSSRSALVWYISGSASSGCCQLVGLRPKRVDKSNIIPPQGYFRAISYGWGWRNHTSEAMPGWTLMLWVIYLQAGINTSLIYASMKCTW